MRQCLSRKAAGETPSQIAEALRTSTHRVDRAIASIPIDAIVALATTTDIVDVVAARSPTDGVAGATVDALVAAQPHWLRATEVAAACVAPALESGDSHAAQVAAIVGGIALDQCAKILRMLRDLRAESQSELEAGWDIVVRPDDIDDVEPGEGAAGAA